MQTKVLTTVLEDVGEEISQELGAKMVKDFQDANPTETPWAFIGKNILMQILSQPDCAGIRYYYAIDENQEKTLVYVGVNSREEIIAEYTSVSPEGIIQQHKGIVADRTRKPIEPPPTEAAPSTTTIPDWTSFI
ncbi:MAG: hypothetical protein DI539_28455 [Flavobacterium psychrophilum]|nr:MAG: hypothetical protein DI539_28455 [Flavobacterium psychrophilum]